MHWACVADLAITCFSWQTGKSGQCFQLDHNNCNICMAFFAEHDGCRLMQFLRAGYESQLKVSPVSSTNPKMGWLIARSEESFSEAAASVSHYFNPSARSQLLSGTQVSSRVMALSISAGWSSCPTPDARSMVTSPCRLESRSYAA